MAHYPFRKNFVLYLNVYKVELTWGKFSGYVQLFVFIQVFTRLGSPGENSLEELGKLSLVHLTTGEVRLEKRNVRTKLINGTVLL